MGIAFLIGLILIAIISLIFSMLAFMGKDIILDNAYIKATKEEQEKMDKNAYRLQAAIIFLFLAAISLCNALRTILHIAWFSYLAFALLAIGIVYTILSHNALKK